MPDGGHTKTGSLWLHASKLFGLLSYAQTGYKTGNSPLLSASMHDFGQQRTADEGSKGV